MHDDSCTCFHHMIVPLCILLIGLVFLLQTLDVLSAMFVGFTWPILLIVIGLTKIFGSGCKCCGKK